MRSERKHYNQQCDASGTYLVKWLYKA